MTAPTLAILLFAAAAALIVLEMLLPAHGVIGLLGAVALLVGIGVLFYLNQALGLAVATGLTVATPFGIALWMKIWPRTPVGRRLFLPPAPPGAGGRITTPPLHVGQTGTTVSELRPMGMCEFEGVRLEARSEHGMIPPAATVRVVSVVDGHVIVRPLPNA